MHMFQSLVDGKEHVALSKGIEAPEDADRTHGFQAQEDPVWVRVHSECLTGDVFGSLRCDCGPQLEKAMHILSTHEKGVLVYLRQEGRGIGLASKIQAYALQEKQGLDTVDANPALGLPDECRDRSPVRTIPAHCTQMVMMADAHTARM